jgi:hypothetical protein
MRGAYERSPLLQKRGSILLFFSERRYAAAAAELRRERPATAPSPFGRRLPVYVFIAPCLRLMSLRRIEVVATPARCAFVGYGGAPLSPSVVSASHAAPARPREVPGVIAATAFAYHSRRRPQRDTKPPAPMSWRMPMILRAARVAEPARCRTRELKSATEDFKEVFRFYATRHVPFFVSMLLSMRRAPAPPHR